MSRLNRQFILRAARINCAPKFTHRWAVALLAAMTVAAGAAREAAAATMLLSPIADAMVSEANPNNNYGGAGAVAVAGHDTPKLEFQTLLKYDTAAAMASFDATFGAGNWQVDGLSLSLTSTSPNNPLFNTSAAGPFAIRWTQNDSWVEGTGTPGAPGATGLTWNTLPGFLSASDDELNTSSFNGLTTGTTSIVLNPDPGIVNDILTGSPISIRLYAPGSEMAGVFNSRSFANPNNHPLLAIIANQVPEPGCGLLAVCAAASLATVRRQLQKPGASHPEGTRRLI